jgi:uncharacterized caspase-like protein
MPPHRAFPPYYANSWALVVGINDYQKTPPLLYARSDAQAVADVLTGRFGFPEEQVTLLLDKDATCERIREAYISYTQ